MGEKTLQQIISLLEKGNISFKHIKHETIPGTSSHEAAQVRGTKIEEAAKALILKTKSGTFIQAIIPAHLRLDLKKIKEVLGEKNVSLASPKDVLEKTSCEVGSVPPFGSLWNMPVFFDTTLLEKEKVVFSAGTHRDSIQISPQDLQRVNKGRVEDLSKPFSS